MESGPLLVTELSRLLLFLLVVVLLAVAMVAVAVALLVVVGIVVAEEAEDEEDGNNAAISCSALLMRFLRPCSAILWDVRFDVKFVERASG